MFTKICVTCFPDCPFQHLIEVLKDSAGKKFYNIAKLGGPKYGNSYFILETNVASPKLATGSSILLSKAEASPLFVCFLQQCELPAFLQNCCN